MDQFASNVALERNLEKELKEVDAALERIAAGKYGVCQKCGQEIELERILAYPAARECVRCKNSH